MTLENELNIVTLLTPPTGPSDNFSTYRRRIGNVENYYPIKDMKLNEISDTIFS